MEYARMDYAYIRFYLSDIHRTQETHYITPYGEHTKLVQDVYLYGGIN